MVTRNRLIAGVLVVGLVALVAAERLVQRAGAADDSQTMVEAPRFEVDPGFPKPLPNGWLMGMAIGVAVDAEDHIWVVHRPDTLSAAEAAAEENPPTAACCRRAPPVLQFAQDGTLISAWGGPGDGYEWPQSNHGLFVDHKGIVWIGGNGTNDAHVWYRLC